MTTTYITTNGTVSGIAHTFAADGDDLYVLNGKFWGSTDGQIFDTSLDNLSVFIGGDVVQALYSRFSGDENTITIASTGSLTSFENNFGNPALWLSGDDNRITNHGSIVSHNSFGIFSQGTNGTIINTGTIEGSSGVIMAYAGSGETLVNSGVISANNSDDDIADDRHNNGVIALRTNTTITNLEGGLITATSSEGAGIKLDQSAGGSFVTNHGDVVSAQGYAVDFSQLAIGTTTEFINTGTIQGGAGSFAGGSIADYVENTGLMIGDVLLNDGDDVFISTGTVMGEINGGAGNDTITTGAADDLIDGGDDNDRIKSKDGDDVVKGGDGNDNIMAGTGDDDIIAGKGADILRGGTGDDTLTGGAGKDTLKGGSGDDILEGGKDADILTGGAGADIFLFKVATHSTSTNTDQITDFVKGSDLIDISAFGATFISNAGFSGTGGAEVRYGTGGSLTRVEVDTDGNGTTDFRVDLGDIGGLTEADFIL